MRQRLSMWIAKWSIVDRALFTFLGLFVGFVLSAFWLHHLYASPQACALEGATSAFIPSAAAAPSEEAAAAEEEAAAAEPNASVPSAYRKYGEIVEMEDCEHVPQPAIKHLFSSYVEADCDKRGSIECPNEPKFGSHEALTDANAVFNMCNCTWTAYDSARCARSKTGSGGSCKDAGSH